jgi:hypothetical protein
MKATFYTASLYLSPVLISLSWIFFPGYPVSSGSAMGDVLWRGRLRRIPVTRDHLFWITLRRCGSFSNSTLGYQRLLRVAWEGCGGHFLRSALRGRNRWGRGCLGHWWGRLQCSLVLNLCGWFPDYVRPPILWSFNPQSWVPLILRIFLRNTSSVTQYLGRITSEQLTSILLFIRKWLA